MSKARMLFLWYTTWRVRQDQGRALEKRGTCREKSGSIGESQIADELERIERDSTYNSLTEEHY
jgi:hypothetical protein